MFARNARAPGHCSFPHIFLQSCTYHIHRWNHNPPSNPEIADANLFPIRNILNQPNSHVSAVFIITSVHIIKPADVGKTVMLKNVTLGRQTCFQGLCCKKTSFFFRYLFHPQEGNWRSHENDSKKVMKKTQKPTLMMMMKSQLSANLTWTERIIIH